jgi:predicted O-methyltransferase YrrM
MSEELWTAVDHFIVETLHAPDPVLDQTLRQNATANLPSIDVAPNQGKLLSLLARAAGARRILEIGTLGGYSTTWLARALPIDGKLITLEFEPLHAKVATANIARAGFASLVEVRIGPATDSLAQLHREGAQPFDFIFIDADKDRYATYLEWSLRLSHPGTVILADNVIREGAVIDPNDPDPRVQGVRRFFELLGGGLTVNGLTIDATGLQTVGGKGHDGFILGIVKLA